jgi:pyruvate/2-oxoacid:ferredoxin oxidoreductase alpha subunit
MKKLMSGSDAMVEAVKMARTEFISAYPITPQTHIIEKLSSMCADGELDATYMNVESEHSAMAAVIGASVTGARTFTATASQGLALMHELLHWAGNGRVPTVMGVVNRALGPGWNIWTDQTDSLSQRDTGWIQLYCTNAQDVFDMTLLAFLLTEMTHIPVMVVQDAYLLSHTYEPIEIPDQDTVDGFLDLDFERSYGIDFDNPYSIFQLTMPAEYEAFKKQQHHDFYAAALIAFMLSTRAKGFFNRDIVLDKYIGRRKVETVLITTGTTANTARSYIKTSGRMDIGIYIMKMLRPLIDGFSTKLDWLAGPAKRFIVIDRNYSPGMGGIWAQEVKHLLQGGPEVPIYSYIAGLGGVDITEDVIKKIVEHASNTSPKPYSLFVEDIDE